MTQSETKSFYDLQVHQIFDVAESCGYVPTGEYFQLNSYENRVFDLFLEGASQKHIIVKIYRPQRWSHEAIIEEHNFLWELKSQGIPAIAPIRLKNGSTVITHQGMHFSFFPKAVGRMPQEFTSEDLRTVGVQLARLHNIGEEQRAHHRPDLSVEHFGWKALDILESWVSPEVVDRYFPAAEKILDYLEHELNPATYLRIHGDCHRGNILQTDPKEGKKEIFFVDFDDFINGPPVQDFWMLLSGSLNESGSEIDHILDGYCQLRTFDRRTLDWIPALRGLRVIHYGSWIAKRWDDPSFPKIFPDFKNYIYWAEEVEALEKIAWSLGDA